MNRTSKTKTAPGPKGDRSKRNVRKNGMCHVSKDDTEHTADESVVKAEAVIKNVDSGDYQIELSFRTVEGERARVRVDRGLCDHPGKVRHMLLNGGADLPIGEADTQVRKALAQGNLKTRARTAKTGWRGGRFILPTRAFGKSGQPVRYFSRGPLSDGLGAKAGDHSVWKKALRQPCATSDIALFVVALGLAGPLMELVGLTEGAIFNLVGESSTGKSFAGVCCRSVTGDSFAEKQPTLDISDRALAELAASHNDLTLVLDEVARLAGGRGEARSKLREIAYTIPSGQGRQLSKKARQDPALENLSWRVLTLTSSEKPSEALGARDRGEQVRLIDIPVPTLADGGIFGRWPNGDAGATIGAIAAALAEHHGHAIELLLKKLTADLPTWRDRARGCAERFMRTAVDGGDSFDQRFAWKFAVVCSAAEIAAKLKIAPWSRERAREAVRAVHDRARELTMSPKEKALALARKLWKHLNDPSVLPKAGRAISSFRADRCLGARAQYQKRAAIFLPVNKVPPEVRVALQDLGLVPDHVALNGLSKTIGGKNRRVIPLFEEELAHLLGDEDG